MTNRSVQIWVVMEYGHEYSKPVVGRDRKHDAEAIVAQLTARAESDRAALPAGFTHYGVELIPFVLKRTF